MELLTTADDGEVVVYECPDCGFQVEQEVAEPNEDQDSNGSTADDEDGVEELEPEDAS